MNETQLYTLFSGGSVAHEDKNTSPYGSDHFFSFHCGKTIKKLRKEIGLTGEELANKLNISQQQVSRYERGINKLTVDMLFDVSAVLNIPIEVLIKKTFIEMRKINSYDVGLLRKIITASDCDNLYF